MTRPETEAEIADSVKRGLNDLFDMLAYRRPHNSKSERRFINRFIRPLGCVQDAFGNLYMSVGVSPTTLWSCHTDTVHRISGRQRLVVDNTEPFLMRTTDGGCLGADDGAGCWVMREMILAKTPGLYVFHRNEERGGQGSAWITKNRPELFEGITHAIAFDRRGTGSIITHQSVGRCCSDEFAVSLADGLGLGHKADTTGSFTDTANYVDLVGECSNVSVGYTREHSAFESLDVGYLFRLKDALLALDQSTLVSKRKPGEHEPRTWGGWGYGDLYGEGYAQVDWRAHRGSGAQPRIYDGGAIDHDGYLNPADYPDELGHEAQPPSLASMCRDHPLEVADFLEALGADESDLWEHICFIRSGLTGGRQ